MCLHGVNSSFIIDGYKQYSDCCNKPLQQTFCFAKHVCSFALYIHHSRGIISAGNLPALTTVFASGFLNMSLLPHTN